MSLRLIEQALSLALPLAAQFRIDHTNFLEMIPRTNAQIYSRAVIEQSLLRKHFPFLRSRISGLNLVSTGRLQPSPESPVYRIELTYKPPHSPQVRVIKPFITYDARIHMYKDDTLCLYDYRKQPWQQAWHIHETVIPWAAEWLLYYELFLETGKWLGKAAPHN
jgi:hypothetical protein